MTSQSSANPFEELYLGETLQARDYVSLFSSFLVSHALPLFIPGNVVLMGVQGSGKSMLLSLLTPAVRLAYAEAGIDFPIPREHRLFVSGGINLRRSGAMSFGQRQIREPDGSEVEQFPFYFADFLNHWILSDLLKSIKALAGKPPAAELGVRFESSRCDSFARELAADDVWFGALEGVNKYADLLVRLNSRIASYLSYLNYNTNEIPLHIRESKTTIGAPISVAARLLQQVGMIGSSCRTYIHVDQYEEVRYLGIQRPHVGDAMRRVINRALGSRDEQVSYKVGARGWAWRENLEMLGTGARIEQDREYRQISLDELLRRKENRSDWIFPAFAEDVMNRRLNYSGLASLPEPLKAYFGSRPDHQARAKAYGYSAVDEQKRSSLMRTLGGSWAPPTSPLSLHLAQAWVRQRNAQRRTTGRKQSPDSSSVVPWEKKYWKKERIEQALLQMAAQSKQRLQWSGSEDVLSLAGGNVLVFVSLCREIWAAQLRSINTRSARGLNLAMQMPFPPAIQNIGIDVASRLWVEKIAEQPDGHSRRRLVDRLGRIFRRLLLQDSAMSNPGNNGFSLLVADLEADERVRRFLRSALDYGELVEVVHTTKERNRMPRLKWYLRPIFSPFFQLPVARTKEPVYVELDAVRAWVDAAIEGRTEEDVAGSTSETLLRSDEQLPLLPT